MKKTGFRKLSFEEALLKARTTLKRAKISPRMKRKSQEVKRYGVKLWSVKKCDIEFSKWLRAKKPMCEYGNNPNCTRNEGLTCSHYIGRSEYATRWLEINCHSFCFSCHAILEPRKQYEYKDWMIKRIGAEKEKELSMIKYTGYKGAVEARLECMRLLGKA